MGFPGSPGRDFKEGLNKALTDTGKSSIDFGSGIWQSVVTLQKNRNEYAHKGGKLVDRFPQVPVVEHAIETMRLAIHDIYKRAGKQSPSWVDFDESSGWPQTGGIVMGSAHVSLIGPGVDPAAPETLRIVLVTQSGEEKATEFLAGETPIEDVLEKVEDRIGSLNVPFSGVRVYRGTNLLHEERLDMRGY